MIPHKWPVQASAPQTLAKQLEIAQAIRAIAAPEEESLRQRHAEIACIRRDLNALALATHELQRACDPRLRSYALKAAPDDPEHPGWPAGTPDSRGGRFRPKDDDARGETSSQSASGSEANGAPQPVRYAALDSGTRTDATAALAGIQYAGGPEDDESESRGGGRPFEGTSAQLARQVVAESEWQKAFSQVLRYDPIWRPTPALVDPNSIEGDIARLDAWTEEAKEHLSQLQGLGFARDPDTGDVIPPTKPKTGNQRIDSTVELLMDIFRKVMDEVGSRPDLTARQYGTLVHTKCADEIRELKLPGIDPNDVERTFGVDGDDTYGAKYSIRADVILRDDDGNIIGIFDFKTGEGLSEVRVIRLRYMTNSDRTVPVIELSRSRGALSKQLGRSEIVLQ